MMFRIRATLCDSLGNEILFENCPHRYETHEAAEPCLERKYQEERARAARRPRDEGINPEPRRRYAIVPVN